MTPEQIEIASSFGGLRYPFGGWAKRFCTDMYYTATSKPDTELSEAQTEWLYRMLYKFRKQLPALYKKHAQHPHCREKSKPKVFLLK